MCSFSQQEVDFEKLFHEKRELCNEQRLQIMQLEEENAILRKSSNTNAGFAYNGFSAFALINRLRESCKEFKLEQSDKDTSFFRLYCYSEEHGEFESEGMLSGLLISATKPFMNKWSQERETGLAVLRKAGVKL